MIFYSELIFFTKIISVLIFVSLILLVFIHFLFAFLKNRLSQTKHKFSEIIINYIKTKRPFTPEKELASNFRLLLQVVENFNRHLKGDGWEPLKWAITNHYLLLRARKWAKSVFWSKRNIAARCFALAPHPEDEEQILQLVDDSKFLVRSIATVAAVYLESEKGIFKAIEHMSRAPGYAYYFYSDILSQGSIKVLIFISQILKTIDNPRIHLVCLKVLSSKTVSFPLPFLEKYLEKKDLQIRLMTLKVLLRNPQKNTVEVFLKCMDDSDENIRAIGALGLGQYKSKETISSLNNALKDESWKVRLEAVRSLKKLGQMDLLLQQSEKNNKEIYEAVQYGIQFED